MTSQQWHSLQPDAQATWDLLSDEAKAIILGLCKDPRKQLANLHNIGACDFIQANFHDFHVEDIVDTDNTPPDPNDDHGDADAQAEEDNSTELLTFLSKQQGSTHPVTWQMSETKSAKSKSSLASPMQVLHLHPRMRKLWSMASSIIKVTPILPFTPSPPTSHANLVHLLIGELMVVLLVIVDVHIIEKLDQTVDVCGINIHQITDIPIVTSGGVMTTQHGPVVAIMHQYAYTGQGKTIHSSGQLEWYKNDVNNKSMKVSGGLQCILTNDGYVVPISIRDGLP